MVLVLISKLPKTMNKTLVSAQVLRNQMSRLWLPTLLPQELRKLLF